MANNGDEFKNMFAIGRTLGKVSNTAVENKARAILSQATLTSITRCCLQCSSPSIVVIRFVTCWHSLLYMRGALCLTRRYHFCCEHLLRKSDRQRKQMLSFSIRHVTSVFEKRWCGPNVDTELELQLFEDKLEGTMVEIVQELLTQILVNNKDGRKR